MNFKFSWLPELIKYNELEPFEKYYENVYKIFENDFIKHRPILNGKKIGLQKEPTVNGKPQTFHHMTTEDSLDERGNKIRKIAIERCERMAWNRAILESNYVGLKIFPEKRSKNRKNLVIWFTEKDYVIVLRDASTYYVFITAYPIKYNHKKKQLQKAYERFKKAETALDKAGSTLFLR